MSLTPQPKGVVDANGEVLFTYNEMKRLWERLQKAERVLAVAVEDAENAEAALRDERRKVRKLLSEGETRRVAYANLQDISEVFEYWREHCKHPRAKLGEDRKKLIAARLEDGYSVDDLKLAIQGAALAAFVDDKGVKHDKLSLILRGTEYVEGFQKRAKAAGWGGVE